MCGGDVEGPAAAAGGGDPDSAGESAERAGALQAPAAGSRGAGAAAPQPAPEAPAREERLLYEDSGTAGQYTDSGQSNRKSS